MAWTTPKTWSTSELVTAAMLNTHLRDNLNALKAPPSSRLQNFNTTISTTSTTWTDLTAGMVRELTTSGGDVLLLFEAAVELDAASDAYYIYLDFDVDGDRVSEVSIGILKMNRYSGNRKGITLFYLVTGLEAGTHEFKPQWRVNDAAATAYIYQYSFLAREVT
ncbi:MAG: hypothetical protein JXJ20_02020 [Anaerolineae bacterium]|jgi:hypothetical protein|nr:hypothetical protein [Anaerolineae bacterium]